MIKIRNCLLAILFAAGPAVAAPLTRGNVLETLQGSEHFRHLEVRAGDLTCAQNRCRTVFTGRDVTIAAAIDLDASDRVETIRFLMAGGVAPSAWLVALEALVAVTSPSFTPERRAQVMASALQRDVPGAGWVYSTLIEADEATITARRPR